MRILTVSNVPLENHLGSGYVISGYVEHLRQRGHDVVTLEPRDFEWIPRLRTAKRLRMLAGYTSATLRTLRRGRFDLVELWGGESAWAMKRLSHRTRRPLLISRSNGLEPDRSKVLAAHGLAENPGILGRWLNRVHRVENAFRCADGLTTVSLEEGRLASAKGYVARDRLLTLENPLPDHWLRRPPAEAKQRILSFVGSWLPWKGSALLEAMLPDVLRKHPAWRARLVGVGDLDTQRIFPPDIVSRVEVVPFVSDRSTLQRLYDESAVLVMPSLSESFGLVAAEAMASGCALVASQVGFAADLRPDEEAVIVPDYAPERWIAVLDALLANESRRKRVALGGHARVQSLRWSDAIERLLKFYAYIAQAEGRKI